MPWLLDYMTDNGLAAALGSGFDGAQDASPSRLPVIRDKHPVAPTVAPIDAQIQTTPERGTEQADPTTEPAAPVTYLAPRPSTTPGAGSAPSNTQSPSPQLRCSKRREAGRK
ncbi:hypothetical protein B9Z19DRAFT_1066565 [Tuber borchii]|uniref:Uncharacterized protein n=1 Tax=Tuber borchii TaxID=42251 RepID=A0A2T6ZM22_TUBBO|nr:hypothetical protein B9Z19DRAFT_1066565 [Tuber borchii]